MKFRVLLLSGVLILFLAMAVSAQAASVRADKPCYGGKATAFITTKGFVPNGLLEGVIDDFNIGLDGIRMNAAGNGGFRLAIPDGFRERNQLTVFSRDNPAIKASTSWQLVPLRLKRGSLDRYDVPIRISVGGFTDDLFKKRGSGPNYLYSHAIPPKGKRAKPYRVRLGRLSRCGGLKVSKRLFPKRPVKGLWTLRINTAYPNHIGESREPQTYTEQIRLQ